MPDPIFRTKDGQTVTKQQLINSGYSEERINKGLSGGILTLAGDTESPNQSFVTKDGKLVTHSQLLQSGYSQERIDKGIQNGILSPKQSEPKKNPTENKNENPWDWVKRTFNTVLPQQPPQPESGVTPTGRTADGIPTVTIDSPTDSEDQKIAEALKGVKHSPATEADKERVAKANGNVSATETIDPVNDPVKAILYPFRLGANAASKAYDELGGKLQQVGESTKQANYGSRKQIDAVADVKVKVKRDNDIAQANLAQAANTVFNKIIPNGKVAKEYLAQKFIENKGALPEGNETVNLAVIKANRSEALKERIAQDPNLTHLAVELARESDPNLDKQIGVLESDKYANPANASPGIAKTIIETMASERGKINHYEDVIPQTQQGRFVDELLHDKDIELIVQEDPKLKEQFDYLKNGGLYEKYPEYGEVVARNRLSREYERRKANMIANPIFNKSKFLDNLSDELFANDPALKKIADEKLKGKWEGKIDTPGVVDEFGTGARHTFQGMTGTLKDVIGAGDSEAERIYKGLDEQNSQVSSGVTGWRKDLGNAANFLGMIGAMGAGGLPVRTLGASPALVNAVTTGVTFYDNELNHWTMKYPGEQDKAHFGAAASTLAYAVVSKAFPSAKVADALAKKLEPSIAEALTKLESGEISAAVKDNLVKKYSKVLLETGKGMVEGTSHMLAVTAFQDGLDQIMGHGAHENEEYVDVARNMMIGLGFPSFIKAYGNKNSIAKSVNSIGEFPARYLSVLDQMKSSGMITEAEFLKKSEDINFLSATKKNLVDEGIPENKQGKFLVEALHEKTLSQQRDAILDKASFIQNEALRNVELEKAKTVEGQMQETKEVQQEILSGKEDEQVAEVQLSEKENAAIEGLKGKEFVAIKPMVDILHDEASSVEDKKAALKEISDQLNAQGSSEITGTELGQKGSELIEDLGYPKIDETAIIEGSKGKPLSEFTQPELLKRKAELENVLSLEDIEQVDKDNATEELAKVNEQLSTQPEQPIIDQEREIDNGNEPKPDNSEQIDRLKINAKVAEETASHTKDEGDKKRLLESAKKYLDEAAELEKSKPSPSIESTPDSKVLEGEGAQSKEPSIPSNQKSLSVEGKDNGQNLEFDGKSVSLQQTKKYATDIETGKAVLERLSPSEERGRTESGKGNVEATILITGLQRSGSKSAATAEGQEAILEDYSRKNNTWVENTEKEFGTPAASGAEALVWYNEGDKSVTKALSTLHHETPQEVLDRIAVHNAIFPETKLEVTGFGKSEDGTFSVIVKQPLIIAERGATKQEVSDHMKELGFEDIGENAYSNSEIIIEDLHPGNVLKDKDGILHFIDPIIRLNTKEQGYGGTRKIGENEIVQESVESTEPIATEEISTTETKPIEDSSGAGEGTKPPAEEKIAESEEDLPERQFTKQMLRSDELSDESKGEISKTLNYVRQTNEMSLKEANDIIERIGVDEAQSFVLTDNELKPVVRVVLGQELIKRYDQLSQKSDTPETKDYYLDKAIQTASFVTERLATEAGQSIQAFSMWSRLSPEGQLRAANQDMARQAKEKLGRREKDINAIGKKFKKANEETANEITTSPSVKKSAEKAETNRVIKAKDKIAAAKKKRENIIKKYKGNRGKNLYSSAPGLTTEGIEFVGDLVATYVQEGVARLEIVVDKVLEHLKEIGGKPINDEVRNNVRDIVTEKLYYVENDKIRKGIVELEKEIGKAIGEYKSLPSGIPAEIKEKIVTDFSKKHGVDEKEVSPEVESIISRKKKESSEPSTEQKDRKELSDLEKQVGAAVSEYKSLPSGIPSEVKEKIISEYSKNNGIDAKEVTTEVENIISRKTKEDAEPTAEQKDRKGIVELEKEIGKIIKEHYTVPEEAKKKLIDKFIEKLGLDKEDAALLSKEVEAEFDKIATRKKRNILYNEKARFDKINNTLNSDKKKDKNTIQSDLIKYSNLGAFEDKDFAALTANKFGIGELSKEEAAKLLELANKVQKAPEGSPKNNATEDLLAYRAKLRGNNLGETAQAVWYANVLSGYKTHEKNLVSTFFNSMGELGAEMAKDPKAIPHLLAGYVKGVSQRGRVEAAHTLKTGRSPIHIKKIETPNTLEVNRYKGGAINPANWFKYVMRLMVAEDVLSFQGLKEARAYQLARREAASQGFNTWSKKGWNKVNEVLYHTKERYAEASIQAEGEGLKPKTTAFKRRIYELMEDSRPQKMTEDAYGFAAKGTFNHESEGSLGALTNAVAGAIDAVNIGGFKPGRVIIPFTRIITNVVNNSLDYTPVGFVRAARGVRGFRSFENNQFTKGAFKDLTPEERKRYIAKASLGIALTATLQALHMAGAITVTGAGPDDPKKKQQLMEEGWQPYSIKIGNKWYSYQYTPMVFMTGFLGNMNDAERYGDTESFGKKMEIAASRIGGQVADMTWINSASTFLGALTEKNPNAQEKALSNSLAGMAKGFIPFSGFVNQGSQLTQNVFNLPQKQVNNAWQAMIADIPIARNSLNDKINALGEPVVRDNDVFVSKESADPVWQYLLGKNGWVAPVNKNTIVVYDPELQMDRPITGDEYYEFSKLRGTKIKEKIQQIIDKGATVLDNNGTPEIKTADELTTQELNVLLTKIEEEATKKTKVELFAPKESKRIKIRLNE